MKSIQFSLLFFNKVHTNYPGEDYSACGLPMYAFFSITLLFLSVTGFI